MKQHSRIDTELLNVRPSHLETDQDLREDQQNFFHSSQNVQRHQFSIPSDPPDSETPTSSCLEPVKERVVSSRSRRRPRSKRTSTHSTPFPPTTTVSHSTPSRFAKSSITPKAEQLPTASNVDLSFSEQIRSQVEAMSIDEIRAAQQEIQDTLKPESIQILKDMWLQRSQTTQPQESSESNAKPTTSEQRTSSLDSLATNNQPQPRAPQIDTHAASKLSSAPDLRSELLIPKEEEQSDEEETKKREWMIDAQQETPSQREVNHFLQKAFENLGDLAKMRFDFDGTVLSPEDIQNLPTHLGLHHHGSSPASAGYALQDILILMRSSVVNQRVLAMRMFKSVILRHRIQIEHVLVNSGILTSVFSYNPTDEPLYAAATSQSAYIELVEALVNSGVDLRDCDSANVLYFGSNFYSPCHEATDNAVAKALADSDIILTLIDIARETALRPEFRSVTERSLSIVFYLLTQIPHAASKLLKNSASLLALKTVATGPAESYPRAFTLCCHVLAQITVSLGWRGGDALESLKRDVINNAFIQKVSSKVIWLLDSDIQEITVSQGLIAKGVLRLIRGALTFQMGIEVFTAIAQMVCRLVRDNTTSTEAFLALEAYSHSLFVRANSQPGIKSKTNASGNTRTDETDYETDVVDENETRRRLSELIPTAISATTFFVDPTSQADESRAAAGHFAATTFALLSYPVAKEYVVRILNVCSSSTTSLARFASELSTCTKKIRGLASLSHAGARLLSKMKLEKTFVRRELDILIPLSDKEKASMENSLTGATGHVISNACSEWIALYSRTGAFKDAAELALKVIPCLVDARVLVDLMSRTILNVEVLQALVPDMTTLTAETCVKDLLPLTMAELQSLHQSEKSQIETERGGTVYMSFVDICNLWVTNANAFESFLHVFAALFKTGLIGDNEMFECMLRSPATEYSDSTFKVMFNLAQSCVDRDEPLISPARNTTLSTLSTTLNSPLVESILSLCDYLSSRGPAPTVSADSGNPDFLASILLSLICGSGIDATLRASMWRRTVDDCGGALLYHNAVALGYVKVENEIMRARYESMLGLFGISISEGFLDGERCPEVIRNTILSLMDALLSVRRSPASVFEVVAVRVRDRTLMRRRLLKMMMGSPALSSRLETLSDFLSKPSC